MSASSPEELETLLEDAVILGDEAAVTALFETEAVLVSGSRTVSPGQALTELARCGYVAATGAVAMRRDTAVVVGNLAVNVSMRSADGTWRLVACLMRAGSLKSA